MELAAHRGVGAVEHRVGADDRRTPARADSRQIRDVPIFDSDPSAPVSRPPAAPMRWLIQPLTLMFEW